MSAAIGHNSGVTLADLLDTDIMQDQLALDHARAVSRKNDLLAGVARFHASHGAGIASDEDQGRAADFVRQIKQAAKDADTAREAAKRPLLNATRTVDAFFKGGIVDPLTAAARGIEDVMTAYAAQKAQEARRAAEEARRKAEEEAARVAAAAERTMHPELLDQAIVAEATAERSRKAAGAGLADLSRTRGELGGVTSLRSQWKWRVVDLSKVSREHLTVDEAKLNAAVKAGLRQADGLEIYEDARAVVR